MVVVSPFEYKTKKRIQSKTLWGIVIALAGMVMQYFGISEEGQGQALDLLAKGVELGGDRSSEWFWYLCLCYSYQFG